jgi:hypothetical protein
MIYFKKLWRIINYIRDMISKNVCKTIKGHIVFVYTFLDNCKCILLFHDMESNFKEFDLQDSMEI